MQGGARAGFSLIEFIIVIGLIALVSGLVITGAGSVLRGLGERPVDEILTQAVREARYQAAMQKETMRLRYDSEGARFVVESETGQQVKAFTIGYDPENVDVRFFQVLPYRGTSRSGFTNLSPLEAPRFRPDRSATPFEAEIRVYDDTSRHRYDPFSDIELSRDDD